MVLPQALLLPLALMPLYIFEPRYQQMLAHALENDRMFCIALMKPGITEATRSDQFYSTVGIGLIRACVGMENGTSNLILQGLNRVQITGWIQEEPFRIAQLKLLPSLDAESVESQALGAKVLELCSELKARGAQVSELLDKQLSQVNDPSALADIVSHTFVGDPFARQQLLEALSVPDRLRLLIAHLQQQLTA